MKKLLLIVLLIVSAFSEEKNLSKIKFDPITDEIINYNHKIVDLKDLTFDEKIILYEKMKLNTNDFKIFIILEYSKIGRLDKYFKILIGGYTMSFLAFISTVSILGGGLDSIEPGFIVAYSGIIATQSYLRVEFKKEYNKNLYQYINDVQSQN